MLIVQESFGFNSSVIRVYKFRTMYADRGDIFGARRTVYNDSRITRVGHGSHWLSLDELHDLFYISNWSLWLDVKTPLLTMPVLLSRKHAY